MTQRAITLVLPYYDNPTIFEEQQRMWTAYPPELRASLHVIVVDDCSPRWPALPHVVPTGIASFSLYRISVDRRWNWIACRNLAMAKAKTEWRLMTDIDHLLPVETLRRLLDGPLDPRVAYRFSRVDAPDLTPYKTHPNTWLMTGKLFDRVGGYDETFVGLYGTDGDFRRRLQAVVKTPVLPDVMIRVPREVIADASTTTYTRKERSDKEGVKKILAAREGVRHWHTKRLSFPYERLV